MHSDDACGLPYGWEIIKRRGPGIILIFLMWTLRETVRNTNEGRDVVLW